MGRGGPGGGGGGNARGECRTDSPKSVRQYLRVCCVCIRNGRSKYNLFIRLARIMYATRVVQRRANTHACGRVLAGHPYPRTYIHTRARNYTHTHIRVPTRSPGVLVVLLNR